MIHTIKELSENNNSKLVLPFHDYFHICPSYTLLNENLEYCGIPTDPKICLTCLKNNKGEFKKFEEETKVQRWRLKWSEIIKVVDEIRFFSNSSKNIFLKAYPDYINYNKLTVVPHNTSTKYDNIYQDLKKRSL